MTALRLNSRIAMLALITAFAMLLASQWGSLDAGTPGDSIIAFTSDRDGNREIYVMRVEGSSQTNLTHNPANDIWPSWSPDNAKIAFWSERDGNDEVFVMNPDGTGQTNLTNSAGSDCCPTWSPDGSKIAFRSARDGNWEIYVMNADGSGQTRLTDHPAGDWLPAWSNLAATEPSLPPTAIPALARRGLLAMAGAVGGCGPPPIVGLRERTGLTLFSA